MDDAVNLIEAAATRLAATKLSPRGDIPDDAARLVQAGQPNGPTPVAKTTSAKTVKKATTIEADIARLEWKETGGAANRFQSYKHNSYLISADHRMGPWRFAASFTWADRGSCALFGGADCSTDGLEGNQGSIGASYSLSRRTQLFAIAARLTNGKSARYNNADWLDAVTPGLDINQVAVGMVHSF